MARPPEGKRQASFPGAVFLQGARPGAARTVLRTVPAAFGRGGGAKHRRGCARSSHAPPPAYSRTMTAAQPAHAAAPHKSSSQKIHLLLTQRST